MRTPTTLTVESVLAAGRELCEPGERKAWVYDLWQLACPTSVSLQGFKGWLLEKHLTGELELSRYDLADREYMSKVSEVSYLNATWHRLIVR